MAEQRKKLLVISDAPSYSSGLARICRDLTTRIHANLGDVYNLATAGYGSPGSSKFPWTQYNLEGMSDWILPTLPDIVADFAGKERCTIFFIWDCSRLGWFSQPKQLGNESLTRFPGLTEWLLKANIEKWIYCPLDASGPNDRLTFPQALTLMGFDRILAYGPFGEGVIRRTIGDEESDKRHLANLPHGIDGDTFFSLHRKLCRKLFLKHTGAQNMFTMLDPKNQTTPPLADDEILVGIVGTNQSRKDWALGLETCAILARDRKLRVWIHTDGLERNWSIPSLLVDYGLIGTELITLGYLSDNVMAECYSACDLTLGIGPEGFGFPAAESLACATPVVTGSYAGAADFVPEGFHVEPVAFRYEGSYSCKRPVYNASDWAEKADHILRTVARLDVSLGSRYEWKENWKAWELWFREAAK